MRSCPKPTCELCFVYASLSRFLNIFQVSHVSFFYARRTFLCARFGLRVPHQPECFSYVFHIVALKRRLRVGKLEANPRAFFARLSCLRDRFLSVFRVTLFYVSRLRRASIKNGKKQSSRLFICFWITKYICILYVYIVCYKYRKSIQMSHFKISELLPDIRDMQFGAKCCPEFSSDMHFGFRWIRRYVRGQVLRHG